MLNLEVNITTVDLNEIKISEQDVLEILRTLQVENEANMNISAYRKELNNLALIAATEHFPNTKGKKYTSMGRYGFDWTKSKNERDIEFRESMAIWDKKLGR